MEIGVKTFLTALQTIWFTLASSGPLGVSAFLVTTFVFIRDRRRLYRFLGPYGHRTLNAWVRRWEIAADRKEVEVGTLEAHKAAAEVLLATLKQSALSGGVLAPRESGPVLPRGADTTALPAPHDPPSEAPKPTGHSHRHHRRNRSGRSGNPTAVRQPPSVEPGEAEEL